MENSQLLGIGILIAGAIFLIGVFATKTPGFGRYSTSILLLGFVMTIAGMAFAFGRIGEPFFGHVLFAVIGFAGGLLVNRVESPSKV